MASTSYSNIQGSGFGLNRLGLQFPTESNAQPTLPMSAIRTLCGLPLWMVNAAVGLETELVKQWEGNE